MRGDLPRIFVDTKYGLWYRYSRKNKGGFSLDTIVPTDSAGLSGAENQEAKTGIYPPVATTLSDSICAGRRFSQVPQFDHRRYQQGKSFAMRSLRHLCSITVSKFHCTKKTAVINPVQRFAGTTNGPGNIYAALAGQFCNG